MAKIKVNENITKMLSTLSTNADRVAKKTYEYFVAVTPKQTGNARRKTKLAQQGGNSVIQANYAYATQLDQGASSQAPQGMVQPAVRAMDKFFKEEFNNKG